MTPALSALLVTQDNVERLRTTLRRLAAQTACNQIELVFAAPSHAMLNLRAEDYAEFAGVQIVEVGQLHTREQGYAAAVKVATSPLVAIIEDHAWPEPTWAEALLRAFSDPAGYAAVGPAIVNANPDTAVSWAHLIFGFGRWVVPVESQRVTRLPSHNSCYRREVLLARGDALEYWLAAEILLHDALTRSGQAFFLAADARTHHVNISRLRDFVISQFNTSRMFGALRCKGWSFAHRLLYIVGSPLIPLVLWSRIAPATARIVPPALRLKVYLALALAMLVSGYGEMAGYVFGMGKARERVMHYEVERFTFLTDADLRQMTERYGR